MDNPYVLSLLYGLGLAIALAEVFLPSGGILGAAATLCLVTSIWNFYSHGHVVLGTGAIFLLALYVPAVFVYGLRRVTSKTNLGKSESTGRDVQAADSLIGSEGEAVTALRPSGVALVEGQRFDVVASNGFVDAGARVRVLETGGNRIVVRGI